LHRQARILTLPRVKAGDASQFDAATTVVARLAGLPSPFYVSSRILVAVQDETTGEADMGPHGETLLHAFPTPATVLGGIGGWYGDDSTASVCCFADQDGSELCPARVVDRRVEAGFAPDLGECQKATSRVAPLPNCLYVKLW
jgi:hypothetical protein